MQQPVPPVAPQTSFRELADRFLASTLNHFPVVDASRRLIGIVALQDLKQYLGAQQDLESVIAFDVMRPPPPCLTPDQRVLDAVPILVASELRNVPVVNTLAEMRLVGAVNRPEALGLLAEAIDTGASRG
jgi:CIC family chloride channel protein